MEKGNRADIPKCPEPARFPLLHPLSGSPQHTLLSLKYTKPSLSGRTCHQMSTVFWIALNHVKQASLWVTVKLRSRSYMFFLFVSFLFSLISYTELAWWNYRLYSSSSWEDALKTNSARSPVTFGAPGAEGWTAAAFKNRTGIATEDLEAGINVMSKVVAWEIKIGKV